MPFLYRGSRKCHFLYVGVKKIVWGVKFRHFLYMGGGGQILAIFCLRGSNIGHFCRGGQILALFV